MRRFLPPGNGGRLSALFCVLSILYRSVPSRAQEIDLLLKGGHVIDPKNNIDADRDVAITAGKIVRVAPDIPTASAKKTVDVKRLLRHTRPH
jgi:dihydroorotase